MSTKRTFRLTAQFTPQQRKRASPVPPLRAMAPRAPAWSKITSVGGVLVSELSSIGEKRTKKKTILTTLAAKKPSRGIPGEPLSHSFWGKICLVAIKYSGYNPIDYRIKLQHPTREDKICFILIFNSISPYSQVCATMTTEDLVAYHWWQQP